MAKFMEEVEGTSGLSRTNHVLRSVLSGDVESGRHRLTRALEKLGYHVISENPLYARRSARGSALYYCSFAILDYPRKLKIGLKPLSPNATLATFDYAAEHFAAVSSKGDLQTLKLEAEAIIALASQSAAITLCTACGTNQTDDYRFCRVCGAPNVGGAPAELEVLRLTAAARAGHHKIAAAVVWAWAPLLGAFTGIIFLGAKFDGLTIGILSALIINLMVWFFVLNASRRTLQPNLSQEQTPSEKNLTGHLSNALGEPTVSASSSPEQKYVTEGTTELLGPHQMEREKELAYRMGRDTSPTG